MAPKSSPPNLLKGDSHYAACPMEMEQMELAVLGLFLRRLGEDCAEDIKYYFINLFHELIELITCKWARMRTRTCRQVSHLGHLHGTKTGGN